MAIAAGASGDVAVLEVADTGIGIGADEVATAVRPDVPGGRGGASPHPGTGLGLTIVKAIVDAHDGSIAVESEPGKGATFRVELPLWRHRADPRSTRVTPDSL